MDFALDFPAFYTDFSDTISGPSGDFVGLVDEVDVDAFSTARIGTHRVRYLSSVVLTHGDALTISSGLSAGTYTVQGVPRRLNNSEFEADLVKQ